jgi:amidase
MARSVKDLAQLLDGLVGYDPEDPVTALGIGMVEGSYTKYLDQRGLVGARIGILRESIGVQSEPESEDFKKVDAVFEKNVAELKAAGAVVIDPILIPNLKALLARRANNPNNFEAGLKFYLARNPNSPIKSHQDIANSPELAKSFPPTKADQWKNPPPTLDAARYLDYLQAREELMFNVLKVNGRQQTRRHRSQDCGTPTDFHQRWDQSALFEQQGRADLEHLPGLCRLDDGAVGIHH